MKSIAALSVPPCRTTISARPALGLPGDLRVDLRRGDEEERRCRPVDENLDCRIPERCRQRLGFCIDLLGGEAFAYDREHAASRHYPRAVAERNPVHYAAGRDDGFACCRTGSCQADQKD